MTSKTDVILRGPENWIEWHREFKTKAIAMHLWDCIKENPEDLYTKPVRPNPDAYKTPGASSSTATASDSSVIDLTPEESRNFKIAWDIYKAKQKEYDDQSKHIQDLKGWVMQSIARQYKHSSCDPSETLHQWYTKLKEHASFDAETEKKEVRMKYRAAVTPLTKPPRDWDSWILAWEEAMTLGEEQGLADTKDPAAWFNDFLEAIYYVAGPWASSYRMLQEDLIKKRTRTYRKVANDLRKETRPVIAVGRSPLSQSDMGDASYANQHPGKTGTKRERNTTSKGDEYCLACERFGHSLEDCFYVFKDKAFDGFRFRKHLQQRVDKNLKKEEVNDELRRLRKRPKHED